MLFALVVYTATVSVVNAFVLRATLETLVSVPQLVVPLQMLSLALVMVLATVVFVLAKLPGTQHLSTTALAPLTPTLPTVKKQVTLKTVVVVVLAPFVVLVTAPWGSLVLGVSRL